MANALDLLPFGTQYYRANTPRPDAWERDIANIRAHGFNTVKLMITWSWCHTSPDVFRFEDYDQLMELCHKNGLRVILNPVYPAPMWLVRKYPESQKVTNDGEVFRGGELCLHHESTRRERMRFLHETVQHFKDHPALMCWDVANEPEVADAGHRTEQNEKLTCCCNSSITAFQQWLQKKYGDIETLNAIWVRRYNDFTEIDPPSSGFFYADMIDWRLFMVDSLTAECRLRVRTAKEADPSHPVMIHSVTMPFFPLATCCCDEYAVAQDCDLFGNTLGSEPLSAAITLAAGQGKMVLNSEIHAIGGSTYDRPSLNGLKEMKRHIYGPLAQGIKGFVFWQYRPERLSFEAPAWGLTDLAGNSTPWLDATEKLAAAVQKNADIILGAIPHVQAAVINSQRGQLFDFCARPGAQWYIDSISGAHSMFRAAGYEADVIGELQLTPEFLARYKVLYDPFPYYKDATTCAILKNRVKNGGTLIAESCFGGFSADENLHTIDQPGFGFDEVFGAKELRITTAANFTNAYGSSWAEKSDKGFLRMTMDGQDYAGFHFYQALQPTSGQVLATFEDGTAAIVANRFGRGCGIWIGSLAAYPYKQGAAENAQLLAKLLHSCTGLVPELATDRLHTMASLLSVPAGQLIIVDNQTDTAGVCVQLNNTAAGQVLCDILTGEEYPVTEKNGHSVVHLPVEAGGIEAYRLK